MRTVTKATDPREGVTAAESEGTAVEAEAAVAEVTGEVAVEVMVEAVAGAEVVVAAEEEVVDMVVIHRIELLVFLLFQFLLLSVHISDS